MDEVAPTRAQRAAGAVGVALGGGDLAALSNGDKVDNPRHLDSRLARLRRAQRTLSRRREDSGRRRRAVVKVARLHHQIAERRATGLHTLTKRVATGWADVAIRDLDVLALTASAPGRGGAARAKAERNRAVLDVAPGEVRRQLEYKTTWYGSRLTVVGRGLPSGKACSACRAVKAKLPSTERVFHCDSCGFSTDRGVNEACNIVAAAFPPG
jgi:putative transposase